MTHLAHIQQVAESRGLTVHESVTAERLAAVDMRLMEGHAIRGQRESITCGFDWDASWSEGAFAVPGKIGVVGQEVIAPPKTDQQLSLVLLPGYRVVAHIDGAGSTQTDTTGEFSETHDLTWTVLE